MTVDDLTPLTPAPADPRLAGRRIAITGATGGIGRSLVELLAGGGGTVVATGRSTERLAELAATAPGLRTRPAELTDEADVAAFYRFARAELGGLDVVINLAGVSVPGPVAETDVATYHRIMGANVLATFLSCKHAVGALAEGGLIINVGSLAGRRANPTAPLYCTAKAAVAMFGEALALQLKANRIRVTTVSPGGADTPFWGDRPVDRSRLLAARDVAEALLFVITRPPGVVVHDLAFEAFPGG